MCMYVESFELSDTHLSNRVKSVYAEYLYENPPITKTLYKNCYHCIEI